MKVLGVGDGVGEGVIRGFGRAITMTISVVILNNCSDDMFCEGGDEVCDGGAVVCVVVAGGSDFDGAGGGAGGDGEFMGGIEDAYVSSGISVDNIGGEFESFRGSDEGLPGKSGGIGVVRESGDEGVEIVSSISS
ncbi:hypothetical protein AGMMS49990_03430 [Endomicrobiia bacterium]|nr:hypothetical protein AGMMS49990_03430 [Endomicrobiia bacterium]